MKVLGGVGPVKGGGGLSYSVKRGREMEGKEGKSACQ